MFPVSATRYNKNHASKPGCFVFYCWKVTLGQKVAPTPTPYRKGGGGYPAPNRVKDFFWLLPLCWRASQLYLIRNCNWGRGSDCAAGFLLLLLPGAPPPSLDRTYQTSRLKRYCILQIVFFVSVCIPLSLESRLQYIPLSLESSGQHTLRQQFGS